MTLHRFAKNLTVSFFTSSCVCRACSIPPCLTAASRQPSISTTPTCCWLRLWQRTASFRTVLQGVLLQTVLWLNLLFCLCRLHSSQMRPTTWLFSFLTGSRQANSRSHSFLYIAWSMLSFFSLQLLSLRRRLTLARASRSTLDLRVDLHVDTC